MKIENTLLNTFCEKILDVIQDRDSNYISNVLDDFREEMLNHCVYWNEKYYRNGFVDGIQLIGGCIIKE